jgi:hypothetical protein
MRNTIRALRTQVTTLERTNRSSLNWKTLALGECSRATEEEHKQKKRIQELESEKEDLDASVRLLHQRNAVWSDRYLQETMEKDRLVAESQLEATDMQTEIESVSKERHQAEECSRLKDEQLKALFLDLQKTIEENEDLRASDYETHKELADVNNRLLESSRQVAAQSEEMALLEKKVASVPSPTSSDRVHQSSKDVYTDEGQESIQFLYSSHRKRERRDSSPLPPTPPRTTSKKRR